MITYFNIKSIIYSRELASISDVITIEIEHVNVDPLDELEKAGRIVHPSPATIRIIQVSIRTSNLYCILQLDSISIYS